MTEPIDLSPAAPAAGHARAGGRSDVIGSGVAVAASAAGGNLLGAAITVALAHYYSGARFGALAALLAIGLVATVPATGMQYVIARRAAQSDLGEHEHDRTSLRYAVVLGVGIALTVCALSPLLSAFLDVPVAAVMAVGVSVAPYMLNSAQLGTLLARTRLVRFAIGQVVLAALRFAGIAVACALHAGVTGVMVALAVSTALAVGCCVPLTGLRTWTAGLPGERTFARDIARATLDLAGISVVMNMDLLLARHYLSAAESGVYALGALFAKAGLWAAQFVPQLIFARLARSDRRRTLLMRGVIADAAVGVLVLAGALALGRPVLQVVSGDADPVAAARLAPLFALLGAGWAICYLVLLASVATQDRGPSRVLWVMVAAEALCVIAFLHASAMAILATVTVGTALLAGAMTGWSCRPATRTMPLSAGS